jgi:hypothetical protein
MGVFSHGGSRVTVFRRPGGPTVTFSGSKDAVRSAAASGWPESINSPNEGPAFRRSENLVGCLRVFGVAGESDTVEANCRNCWFISRD